MLSREGMKASIENSEKPINKVSCQGTWVAMKRLIMLSRQALAHRGTAAERKRSLAGMSSSRELCGSTKLRTFAG
jgi:hypothetical protein